MANDRLGDLDGPASSGQQAENAPEPVQGEAAPSAAPEPAQAEGAPAAQADPWQEKLPAFASEKFGVGSYGEMLDQMEAARSQMQEQQSLTAAYQDLIRMYSAGAQQRPAAASASAPSAQNDWFGYGSKEAYVAAFNLNPQEVRAREIQAALSGRPELRSQFQEIARAEMAPLREAAYRQTLEADYRNVAAKYPEAADPAISGDRGPVMQYVRQNPWIEQLKHYFPGVNIHEVAFKLGHYDVLAKQIAAARAGQRERAAAAGTARANVGGAAVQKAPKTHADAAERAAERLRAAGIDVPAEMVEVAKRGIDAGGVQQR